MTTSNNDLNYDEGDKATNKNKRDKTKTSRRRIPHQSNRYANRKREKKIQKIADSIRNKVNNTLNPSDRIVAFYANKFKEAKEKERAAVNISKSRRKPKKTKTFEVSSKTKEVLKIDPKNKKVEGKSLIGRNVTQPAVSSTHNNASTNATNATATKDDEGGSAAFSVAVGNRPSLVLSKRRFYRDIGKKVTRK